MDVDRRRDDRLRSLPEILAGDALVLGGAFWLAYLLRFDFAIPSAAVGDAVVQTPAFVALSLVVAWMAGIYRVVGRYVGLSDVARFAVASVVAAVPMVLPRLAGAEGVWRIPLSVTLVASAGGFIALLLVRVLERAGHEHRRRLHHQGGASGSIRTILVGAGDAGVQAVREVQRRGDTGLLLVGFVDDDPLKQGSRFSGIEVLGRIDDIPELAEEFKIEQVVITIVDPSRDLAAHIVEICDSTGVGVRQIPGFFEIIQGSVSLTRFRSVAIEDLLPRDPVELNASEISTFLAGKNVMVTGAGGSIGSELTRQIAEYRPHRLLLVERSEGALFTIDREMKARFPQSGIDSQVADVGDGGRMRTLFAEFRPDVVLHAAAHKHVAMMEVSPCEAVKNNVRGTMVVADLAGEYKAEAFVLISTDKAVRPSSIMGATKRVAELLVQSLTNVYLDTRYLSVRFGNVMGSSGSVVPIFQEQIRNGGPVTVTDPDATRYFMTIPEAGQLVLQAGAIARSGEVMVLDMGEPMRIIELAERLIELSGFRPYLDIEIEFTGLKPGEKLHEELDTAEEELVATQHAKIFATTDPLGGGHSLADIQSLVEIAADTDPDQVKAALSGLVPEASFQE